MGVDAAKFLKLFVDFFYITILVAQRLDIGKLFGDLMNQINHFFAVVVPDVELLGNFVKGLVDLFLGAGIFGDLH